MAIANKRGSTLDDIVGDFTEANFIDIIRDKIDKNNNKVNIANSVAYLSLVVLPFTQPLTGVAPLPDYIAHPAAFAGLAAVTERAFATAKNTFLRANSINLAYGLSWSAGLATELYQGMIPERSISISDELLNIGGALVGAVTFRTYNFLEKLSKIKNVLKNERLFNQPIYTKRIVDNVSCSPSANY